MRSRRADDDRPIAAGTGRTSPSCYARCAISEKVGRKRPATRPERHTRRAVSIGRQHHIGRLLFGRETAARCWACDRPSLSGRTRGRSRSSLRARSPKSRESFGGRENQEIVELQLQTGPTSRFLLSCAPGAISTGMALDTRSAPNARSGVSRRSRPPSVDESHLLVAEELAQMDSRVHLDRETSTSDITTQP